MDLSRFLQSAAARVGLQTAALIHHAGEVAYGVRQSFAASYQGATQQAEELRKAASRSHRANILGINPEWYDALARQYGEETLMAALHKADETSKVRGGLLDWKGLIEDPFEPIASYGGWREKPAVISYGMLESLSRRVPPFTAYLQTRLNQIVYYCDLQADKHGPGFVIRKKDEEEQKGKKSKKQNSANDKRSKEIAKIVMQCGVTPREEDPETGEIRDGFHQFMKKIVRDTLVYDQVNIEKRRDRAGRVVEWRALDAKTIRMASADVELHNDDFNERVRYAQVINGTAVAEFSRGDLTFGVRNPRTDLRVFGYGFSELEMCVAVVTAILNGFDYNARYFTQGTSAKGVLSVVGTVPDHQLRAFRRMWTAMVTGAKNAWRTPILNIQDEKSKVSWIDIQKSNLDMEYSKWLDWLLRAFCGVLQISPEEIGYQLGNMGQSHTMSESNVAEKIEASRDRGLRPLLTDMERMLNEEIVSQIDDQYELAFVGLDLKSEQAEIEMLVKEVGSYKMLDEAREARNLDPLPDGKGEVVLNAQWIQAMQMKQQQDMMAAQSEGEGGAPGGFDSVDEFGFSDSSAADAPQQQEVAKSLTRSGKVHKLKSDSGAITYEIEF